MKFTLSWLKEHLDTTASVEQIAETLTKIGLEVEEVFNPASRLGGFVTAEVETYGPHPDSDHLGLLTVNSLAAANSVMIPVQCQYFALEGLGKLLNTIKIIQKRLNMALEIEGFVLTMYDGRVRLSNQVRKHFEEMVFDTLIQQNVKLAEAPSYGQPVILYDAECRGSVNYLSLANELLEKNKKS